MDPHTKQNLQAMAMAGVLLAIGALLCIACYMVGRNAGLREAIAKAEAARESTR